MNPPTPKGYSETRHNCQYCCDCGCSICYSMEGNMAEQHCKILKQQRDSEEKRILDMIKAVKCDGSCKNACTCTWKRKDKQEIDISKPFRREVERE